MKTKKDDFFTRNSDLSMEFSKYVLEHPEMDEVLNGAKVVIFLPEFDLDLKDFNLRMAKDIEAEGGEVLFIRVKDLSPKVTSRLIGVEFATP
jgi:hypothetical protein